MQVHVKNMKLYTEMLKKKIQAYEENDRNLWNEMNISSSYWQDFRATKFYDSTRTEQVKIKNTIKELYSMQEIYNYFVEQYASIGNHIFFDLDKKDRCIRKLDIFIQKIKEVENLYKNLDTSFCPQEKNFLEKEAQNLNKIRNELQKIKEEVINTFLKIEEIETNIQLKLSKIQIEFIKETDKRDIIGEIE